MRPTTLIRQQGFFVMDRFRRGHVRAHTHELESTLADPTSETVRVQQRQHLRDLLRHVSRTVPYYADLDPATIEQADLAALPVMTKREYLENYDELCCTDFDISALPTVSTSGSTAIPLRVPRDPGKRQRHVADLITFGRLAGYHFGDQVVFLTVSRGLTGRTFSQRLQGIRYVRAQVLDDDLVATFEQEISSSKPGLYLFGFPSALEFIGRRLKAVGHRAPAGRLAGVMAISEANTPWLTQHAGEVFNAPVFSRYANEENGIMAQQTIGSDGRFVVNHASYIVEVLGLQDSRPVEPGVLGRIVITDLFARAMPFIRYDTGDLGRWSTTHPADLAEVVGRRGDIIFGARDQAIAPASVLYKLLPFDDIRHFQFAQVGRSTYRLSIVADRDGGRDAKIIAALTDLLGDPVSISIEYVPEVAPMPSGKRRPVANLWRGPSTNT